MPRRKRLAAISFKRCIDPARMYPPGFAVYIALGSIDHLFQGDYRMTTSKIRIKLGAIEVEYEGSESFLKEELLALLSAVSDLYQRSNPSGLGAGDESSAAATGTPCSRK